MINLTFENIKHKIVAYFVQIGLFLDRNSIAFSGDI